MVLAELGGRINAAIHEMSRSTIITDEVIDKMLSSICRALLDGNVNVKLVKDLRDRIKTKVMMEDQSGFNKRKLIQQTVFQELRNLLDPGVKPFKPEKGRQNVVMFVGLQGHGKTTTCTKYALYYQNKGWKVGLVCADTFRAGAYDQLKQNAAKAKVRFHGSLTETDPVMAAREGVEHFKKENMEIIIVDTSGRHKQEASLFEEMRQIEQITQPDDIIFVMDSSIGQAAHDHAKAFKDSVSVGSVILTKMDGDSKKGGGALSAVAATHSPILFIGTGEHFGDLQPFDPNSFVSQLLGMGNVQGLMEKIKDAGIDQNSELYQRLTEGVFTLRDMREHLEKVTSMGSLGKIMEMLPGMGQHMNAMLAGEHSATRLKAFMCMMDSMNDKELDAPNVKKMMTPERQARIARGSGRSLVDVAELLKAYQKFEEMVKKMGRMDLRKLENPNALQGKQGAQQISQLARALDPQVLAQIGGVGGLQHMMKQISTSEHEAKLGGGGGGGPPRRKKK